VGNNPLLHIDPLGNTVFGSGGAICRWKCNIIWGALYFICVQTDAFGIERNLQGGNISCCDWIKEKWEECLRRCKDLEKYENWLITPKKKRGRNPLKPRIPKPNPFITNLPVGNS
jgi:hypothetical protein